MRKSDLTYLLCSFSVAAVSVFYCATMWFSIKLPRYYPLEHVWKWAKEKGVPSQGWYGMQAFAYLATGITTLLLCLVLKAARSRETRLPPAVVKGVGVAATVIAIACMGYMLYHEFCKWGILA